MAGYMSYCVYTHLYAQQNLCAVHYITFYADIHDMQASRALSSVSIRLANDRGFILKLKFVSFSLCLEH